MTASLTAELREKQARLLAALRGYGSCLVAFSGGVDSAVVAKAAHLALGDRAVAVTGVSASLASGELDEALAVAQQIGVRHEVVATTELDNPDYQRNAPDRCYHCKTELYGQCQQLLRNLDLAVIANGANVDDLSDYRPGMQAAAEVAVRSPLVECGITKAEVRQLAADWNLPIWDKPATPCLSSRIAPGETVTPERLAMIDAAESFLRGAGFRTLRVRWHAGDIARIEVPLADLERLCTPPLRDEVARQLQSLGFRFVTIDLAGFRSGSLHTLIPIETLRAAVS